MTCNFSSKIKSGGHRLAFPLELHEITGALTGYGSINSNLYQKNSTTYVLIIVHLLHTIMEYLSRQ